MIFIHYTGIVNAHGNSILYQDGWTALQSASSLGYADVVKELLSKSKSSNKKNQVTIVNLSTAPFYTT